VPGVLEAARTLALLARIAAVGAGTDLPQVPASRGGELPACLANPHCPADPVFISCSQGPHQAGFVLAHGERVEVFFGHWRSPVVARAMREGPRALTLELEWVEIPVTKRSRRATLTPGVTRQAHGATPRQAHGTGVRRERPLS